MRSHRFYRYAVALITAFFISITPAFSQTDPLKGWVPGPYMSAFTYCQTLIQPLVYFPPTNEEQELTFSVASYINWTFRAWSINGAVLNDNNELVLPAGYWAFAQTLLNCAEKYPSDDFLDLSRLMLSTFEEIYDHFGLTMP